MISWLICKASESDGGTPSSGTPAQLAAWPEESALCPLREHPPVDKDKAYKERAAVRYQPADLFRTDFDGNRSAGAYDRLPVLEASVGWGADRGEEVFA